MASHEPVIQVMMGHEHLTGEVHKQDGQVHCPYKEPDNRSHRPSALNIQRHTVLDEETPPNVMDKR